MHFSIGDSMLDNSGPVFKIPLTVLSQMRKRRHTPSVPDISLECDETIDWDDFDNSYTSIYSPQSNEKLQVPVDSEFRKYEFLYSHPPPNSPNFDNTEIDDFSPGNNKYVNSLLQLWKDSESSASSSQGSSHSNCSDEPVHTLSRSDTEESQYESMSSDQDQSQEDDRQVNQADGIPYRALCHRSEQQPLNNTSLHEEVDLEEHIAGLLPVSQSSSRSVSPAELEALSQSVIGLAFENAESGHDEHMLAPSLIISQPDELMQIPSPISSLSSSPRFLRSPSPSDIFNHSFHQSIQMNDSMESFVFYDDRYIFRSVSPSVLVDNHRVPDIDMELYDSMSLYDEVPAFPNNRTRRALNSCQDQVVPEFLEE